MFRHSTNTPSLCSVLIAALIVSLSLAGVAVALVTKLGVAALENNNNNLGYDNTASRYEALTSNTTANFNTAIGRRALSLNTVGHDNTASGYDALHGVFFNDKGELAYATGSFNTASGSQALRGNHTGNSNTASGTRALQANRTGNFNTAIGAGADVRDFDGNLSNTTAIGAGAQVNVSDKVRLGNTAVTVIEGQVAFTSVSDKTKKENFQPVDGEAVLGKIRGFALSSWNFMGHDPQAFRHYGPMAQDFFAAFGHDGVGQIGSETTINAGDMAGILMSAVQALEKRTAELQQKEAQMAVLESKLEAVAARLEALELHKNPSLQITAEKSRGSTRVDVLP
jgi:hypothetical protein